MLREMDLAIILLPFILLSLIGSVYMFLYLKGKPDPYYRIIFVARVTIISLGLLLILVTFCLPYPPAYPNDLTDIAPKQLLNLLQNYHRTIVRINEIFHWFLFVFVFWFLGMFLNAIEAINKIRTK